MNRIIKRLAVPLSAAAVLGTAGFAYMASNTVPGTNAGAGQGTISGYTVSNVSYGVVDHGIAHASVNAQVKTVTFDLSPDHAAVASPPAPSTLWVTLETTPNSGFRFARYDTCVLNSAAGTIPFNYTCTFKPLVTNSNPPLPANPAVYAVYPSLSDVTQLDVSAAQ